MATHVDERKVEKKMEEHKQQLTVELALNPVDDLVELEEIVEEAEGGEEGETPIRDCQEKIKKKEEKEKQKEEETKEKKEKEKKLKNEKQKQKVVETEKKKGKSEDNKKRRLLNARRYLINWYPPGKIKSDIWPYFLISLRNWKLLCYLEKHFSKCPYMPNF